jgi:hypothetical protein
MIDAACELASAGWRVFPCWPAGPRAKSPLTEHGHLDASRDQALIRQWWTRWPYAMIGAAVPDSYIVLDIDPRNGGSVQELEAFVGPLPDTLTAWSGRNDGGRHLYLRRPAGELVGTRFSRGIDLKVRGYMIMPPSAHPVTSRRPIGGSVTRWRECRRRFVSCCARRHGPSTPAVAPRRAPAWCAKLRQPRSAIGTRPCIGHAAEHSRTAFSTRSRRS